MPNYIRSKYTRLQIFYGDDGRRVKTVFVSNIREGTTNESLERKYSTYGPVQSCTLECHADSDELYAIITMDYAFDASKILRDWPEVKPSYSLLPKRAATNVKKDFDEPKKEIIEKRPRLEESNVQTYRRNRTELPTSPAVPENIPSEPFTSRNNEPVHQNSLEDLPQKRLIEKKPRVEEPVVPVLRRRRPATKVKERITDKSPRAEQSVTEPYRRTRVPVSTPPPTPEKFRSEPFKDELAVKAHRQDNATSSTSSTASKEVPNNPFTSLNDDCLLSIFSFCDKFDLVNLAQVCKRFRFIVYNYLRAKISKIVDLTKIKPYDRITICEATKFLKFIDAAQNMQQLALAMSAFRKYNDQLILEEIFKSCGSNLRRITFTGFHFMEGFVTEWKHLFCGLEWLTFNQCIFSTNQLNALLNVCENLEVLNVASSNSIGFAVDDDSKHGLSFEFKCKKLKEFRLISSRHCGKSDEMIWLLENNPNLRVLQILDVGDSINLTGTTLQRIGQFRQMQDLAFSFQNVVSNLMNNLHHLTRLKELKSLSLQCDWMNVSTFARELSLSASGQIESLSIEYIDIDISFMKAIGRFRKLKYLKLENTFVNEPSQEVFEQSLMDWTYRLNNLTHFHCQSHLFTEDSLVQFVARMRRLQHLQISGLAMTLILFMRFVSVCERRVNGLKLKIVIDNYRYLSEYMDMIQSEYGKVIEIQSLYD